MYIKQVLYEYVVYDILESHRSIVEQRKSTVYGHKHNVGDGMFKCNNIKNALMVRYR